VTSSRTRSGSASTGLTRATRGDRPVACCVELAARVLPPVADEHQAAVEVDADPLRRRGQRTQQLDRREQERHPVPGLDGRGDGQLDVDTDLLPQPLDLAGQSLGELIGRGALDHVAVARRNAHHRRPPAGDVGEQQVPQAGVGGAGVAPAGGSVGGGRVEEHRQLVGPLALALGGVGGQRVGRGQPFLLVAQLVALGRQAGDLVMELRGLGACRAEPSLEVTAGPEEEEGGGQRSDREHRDEGEGHAGRR
jgi:hypothetical protein